MARGQTNRIRNPPRLSEAESAAAPLQLLDGVPDTPLPAHEQTHQQSSHDQRHPSKILVREIEGSGKERNGAVSQRTGDSQEEDHATGSDCRSAAAPPELVNGECHDHLQHGDGGRERGDGQQYEKRCSE